MSHLRPQLAILLGAFALAVLISLVASTPAFYQSLSLAAHAMPDTAATGASAPSTDLAVFNLRDPSFFAEFDCVARLVAGMAVQPLVVTGLGFDSSRSVTIDPSAFRDSIRMVFSGSLFMLTLVIFVGLSALRMFLNLHYKTPLSSLVDSINAFSDDPSVASPIAEEVTRSPEFTTAARALETLQRNTLLASEDPRVRRAAPHIVRSLEQSVALVQSMMDYLAETPSAEPVRFAMNDLVREIADSAKLDISYEGPAEVRLDRTMMSRILLNLARNAVHAGAGRLNIDIWRAGRLGVIDIADDGPGIPREHWDDLFLAFRSKQRGGTGLGLAIARDLAVAQGGALKLTRSTEDGSEFRLQLPMEMFATGGGSAALADDRR